jgi:hypothetical protein
LDQIVLLARVVSWAVTCFGNLRTGAQYHILERRRELTSCTLEVVGMRAILPFHRARRALISLTFEARKSSGSKSRPIGTPREIIQSPSSHHTISLACSVAFMQ